MEEDTDALISPNDSGIDVHRAKDDDEGLLGSSLVAEEEEDEETRSIVLIEGGMVGFSSICSSICRDRSNVPTAKPINLAHFRLTVNVHRYSPSRSR